MSAPVNNNLSRTKSKEKLKSNEKAASSGNLLKIGNLKGGAMIMKSVSIFLASGRRASKVLTDKATVAAKTKRANKLIFKVDEATAKIHPKFMDILKRRTQFTKPEIETLCRIYIKLVAKCQVNTRALAKSVRAPRVDGIDRTVFRELMHSTFDIVTEEKLMERIFAAWEKGHDGSTLRLEIFLKGLSVFLRGTFTEKIAFCFRVYDLNSDGYITKDEMFTLLKNSLIKNPQDEDPDEGVKDLVEITMRKLDLDKDGKISFEDYSNAIHDEPLLLEAFGQCLPTDKSRNSFLATLQG